jgi:hypothetical protein
MGKYVAQNFSGQLPAVPVFKGGDVHYCHTPRELEEYTKSRQDGGKEYSTDYEHLDWPKVVSHPTKGDLKVFSTEELRKAESGGYNFDHFANYRAKEITRLEQQLIAARIVHNDALAGQLGVEIHNLKEGIGGLPQDEDAAPGSFNPGSDARVRELEAQNRELLTKLDKVLANTVRKKPGRKPRAAAPEVVEA